LWRPQPPDQYLKQLVLVGIWRRPGGTSPGYLKQLLLAGIWRRPGGTSPGYLKQVVLAGIWRGPGGTSPGWLKHAVLVIFRLLTARTETNVRVEFRPVSCQSGI
jgi:hypothetical protein